MIENLCKIEPAQRELYFMIAFAVWQSVEVWLSKTDKVKAGSTPEALLNALKYVLAMIRNLIWKKPTI